MMTSHYLKWVPGFLELSRQVAALVATPFETHTKKDGSPVTAIDFATQDLLLRFFDRITPGLPVLSEEKQIPSWKSRQAWAQYWLIDPIDGTRELVDGNDEFAICAALIHEGRPVFSTILMPAKDEGFFAAAGQGAYFYAGDSRPVRMLGGDWKIGEPIYVLKSRSHHTPNMSRFLKNLIQRVPGVQPVTVGSAYKFCLLARGDVMLYRRIRPINEWDVASGDLIVSEAGGQMRLADGSQPQYNTQQVKVPGFWAVSSPALAAYLVAVGMWQP
jgi:3'(2'), 5'-bisphosphate nucleotidase